jgi:hypothetical protein
MVNGTQPPPLDITTFEPDACRVRPPVEDNWFTISAWPDVRALSWLVSSAKSLIITLSR